MARIITKELALKIVKKLRAKRVRKSGAHDLYEVLHEGIPIAEISVRHGSERDQGHDHIPGELHVGPNFAKLIGQCPKSLDDWIEELRTKGLLEPDESEDSDSDSDSEEEEEEET